MEFLLIQIVFCSFFYLHFYAWRLIRCSILKDSFGEMVIKQPKRFRPWGGICKLPISGSVSQAFTTQENSNEAGFSQRTQISWRMGKRLIESHKLFDDALSFKTKDLWLEKGWETETKRDGSRQHSTRVPDSPRRGVLPSRNSNDCWLYPGRITWSQCPVSFEAVVFSFIFKSAVEALM